ncbi:SRPBCC family protein [Georgenia deserti]|uniref:SRPBCC family protein n=1 Tax=Georgenia deserti TaxID=2093781 RepID=A0ABW4L572_9MICO
MELTHSFTVPADPATTWELLTDLDRVGSCFPGATVKEATEQEFSGTVKVKLGPIAMQYAGSGTFVERDDDGHRAVIEAKGKDRRGNGTAAATVTMSLTPDGEGTRADVTTDLQVTGKPAQFGRGVMQDVSDKLLGQFVACIERRLGEGEGADGAGSGLDAASSSEKVPDDGPSQEGASATTGAAQSAATAAAGAPAAATATAGSPPGRAAPAREDDDAIDLGSAVAPVLLQRYSGVAAAGLIGLLVGLLLGRRWR